MTAEQHTDEHHTFHNAWFESVLCGANGRNFRTHVLVNDWFRVGYGCILTVTFPLWICLQGSMNLFVVTLNKEGTSYQYSCLRYMIWLIVCIDKLTNHQTFRTHSILFFWKIGRSWNVYIFFNLFSFWFRFCCSLERIVTRISWTLKLLAPGGSRFALLRGYSNPFVFLLCSLLRKWPV